MRIQKYLSERKILSRREAESYIKRGLITLNGEVVRELGIQIDPKKDKIAVLPAGLKEASNKITVAVYKPRGVASSKIKEESPTVFDVFPEFKKLNVVGRLDKDSEGLLLLSNNGVVTRIVTGNDRLIEKEYEVLVHENVTPGKAKKMESGIMLSDGMTLPAKVRILRPDKFSIILKEGRKHQIRRMTSALGLTIRSLRRVRIGGIYLGSLKPGESRVLNSAEIKKLESLSVVK